MTTEKRMRVGVLSCSAALLHLEQKCVDVVADVICVEMQKAMDQVGVTYCKKLRTPIERVAMLLDLLAHVAHYVLASLPHAAQLQRIERQKERKPDRCLMLRAKSELSG